MKREELIRNCARPSAYKVRHSPLLSFHWECRHRAPKMATLQNGRTLTSGAAADQGFLPFFSSSSSSSSSSISVSSAFVVAVGWNRWQVLLTLSLSRHFHSISASWQVMIKMALLLVSFFHQKGFFSSRRWWEGEGERTKKKRNKRKQVWPVASRCHGDAGRPKPRRRWLAVGRRFGVIASLTMKSTRITRASG